MILTHMMMMIMMLVMTVMEKVILWAIPQQMMSHYLNFETMHCGPLIPHKYWLVFHDSISTKETNGLALKYHLPPTFLRHTLCVL